MKNNKIWDLTISTEAVIICIRGNNLQNLQHIVSFKVINRELPIYKVEQRNGTKKVGNRPCLFMKLHPTA